MVSGSFPEPEDLTVKFLTIVVLRESEGEDNHSGLKVLGIYNSNSRAREKAWEFKKTLGANSSYEPDIYTVQLMTETDYSTPPDLLVRKDWA